MTTRQSADALSLWLAENQPQVFEALMRRARGEVQPQLSGISDWLSSIGTSFGGAVKNVGSFLASEDGLKTVTAVGGLYLQTQAQKDALKLQVAQAQAGQAPAPVYSVGANPATAVPVYQTPTGHTQPLTPTLAQQLMPAGLPAWGPFAIGGAVLLIFGFMVATTRR